MRVDMQVTRGLDFKIKHAVARYLIEHMVEKGHAGGDLLAAAAIEIHLDANRRFPGLAAYFGDTHGRDS